MAPKTVSLTVKYSKPGTQPPLFLAGSFSDPGWQPQEMQYTTNEAGEYEFYKEIQVEEGSVYQYKFRVGEGDWWMLNEDSPTVTDDVGNRNNVLSVPASEEPTAEPQHLEQPPAAEEVSHPVSEMENTKSETIAGEQPVENAPIDTQEEEKEVETSDEHAKEHYTITPAHTNTPAGETVEDEEEAAPASAHEAAEIPIKTQLNVQHLREDATTTPAAEDDGDGKAQQVADSIALLHAREGAHSQQEEKQPNKASLEPLLSGTVEPTSTPTVPADQSSSETASSPTLIIEKVDDELRHGDDFGSAATVGQKDAHLLRSQDAVPDHVIMRAESRTPELAETAFEVSESAALLDRDRDPPTPPMSDEEAGRIGYRRMSSTPIPEVAKTAAEVADVAATLDERPALHLETTPHESEVREDDEEDLLDSGASTPASQKAPRFAYECLGEHDIGVPALPTYSQPPPIDPLEPVRSPYDELTEIDWNDPSIEIFPTDRAAIIHTIRRLSERLPEDVPDLDIVPPSPVIGSNGLPIERQSPAPSPIVLARQISPSLDSITEENDEHQDYFASMLEASKLASTNSEKEDTVLTKGSDDSTVVHKGAENEKLDGTHETVEPDSTKSAEIESEKVITEPSVEVEESSPPVKDEIEPKEISNENAEESRQPELSNTSQGKDEETKAKNTEEAPIVELPEGSGEPELTSSEEQSEEKTTAPEQISSAVKEVGPETPPTAPVEPTLNAHAPSDVTPFVVGDKQLGHDEEQVQEIATPADFPNITVQPATPAALKTEFIPKPLDTAKSTAIEEENGRQVKSRKNPRSQSPERPVTPSSMRSATRDAKSKNFLKAFWRVVFVDWIGGLIRALCGGRGGYTLLAAWAIVVVVLAPTLYSSYTGSSLWA